MPDAGAEEQAETPEAVLETATEPVTESPVDSAALAEPAPAAPTGQAPVAPAEPESPPSPPAFGVIDVSGIAPAHPIGRSRSFAQTASGRKRTSSSPNPSAVSLDMSPDVSPDMSPDRSRRHDASVPGAGAHPFPVWICYW